MQMRNTSSYIASTNGLGSDGSLYRVLISATDANPVTIRFDGAAIFRFYVDSVYEQKYLNVMPSRFAPGNRAIRIITTPSGETASLVSVVASDERIKGRRMVSVEGSAWQVYDPESGASVDNPLPGISARLVVFED
jgi:hypothetical protein